MKRKYTTETFINKANEQHNNEYDYSKVIYLGSTIKVEIICKNHGSFWSIPANHIQGSGCKQCANKDLTKNISQFIQEANIIHDNFYDYSQVIYINNDTKIKIICKEHGQFWQKPNSHLQGRGCKECGKLKSSKSNLGTIEHFIAKSKLIHGEKYDYSKSIYIGINEKLEIICKEHGYFWQTAKSHISGNGCPKCGRIKANYNEMGTLEHFLELAHQIHDEKYDYSKSIFIGTHRQIEIICRNHGSFWQIAKNHTSGANCPKCSKENTAKLFARTTQEFISAANIIHNFKYDYNLVEYTNKENKIKIICNTHGIFIQRAGSHLRGQGCSKCKGSISKLETEWLNDIGIDPLYRNIRLPRLGNLKVDGFDPITNTIYEFYGDYWHGNPTIFNPDLINPSTKTTFGELYSATQIREQKIKDNEYNLVIIWERDYNLLKNKLK